MDLAGARGSWRDFVASNDAFAMLPLTDRTAVAAYVNRLFDRRENLRLSCLPTSAAEDFDWARQIALNRTARNNVTCYEAKDRSHPIRTGSRSMWNARDAVMAANVDWMRRHGAPAPARRP